MITTRALNLAYSYLCGQYEDEEILLRACSELKKIARVNDFDFIQYIECSYEEVQAKLATLNERELDRKKKGVYYTPSDVVTFILSNTIKASYGILNSKNVGVAELTSVPVEDFCVKKRILDIIMQSLIQFNFPFDILPLAG